MFSSRSFSLSLSLSLSLSFYCCSSYLSKSLLVASSLQGVHEASLGVLNRLAALEQSRQSVASDAARDRAALALLAGRLAANAGQVAENVAAVDARLAALNL
jgi:hypothetical protein